MQQDKDPRGGTRTGAGRPKGVPNKTTQAQRDAVLNSGLTPLEYMISVLRDETAEREVRMDAAKAAAPYVHPKLANIDLKAEHSGDVGPLVPVINLHVASNGA